MPTHSKTARSGGSGFFFERVKTSSPKIETKLEQSIPDASTNLAISFFVESTGLKSFLIWSDRVITVKTNSSGAPQETFSLNGLDATSWIEGEASPPIAGDVTQLFVTNASGGAALLKLLAGWG